MANSRSVFYKNGGVRYKSNGFKIRRDRKTRKLERLEDKPCQVPFSKDFVNECRKQGIPIEQ